MKTFMSKKMGIILVSFVFMVLCAQTGLADSLSITGIVKSVDSGSGLVTLAVTSEGCRGLRTFRMPDDARDDLNASFIGKKLQFNIDSAKCEQGKIYNIVFKEQP